MHRTRTAPPNRAFEGTSALKVRVTAAGTSYLPTLGSEIFSLVLT